MPGRRILRRFSASISDLLSIQRKNHHEGTESGTSLHQAVQMGNAVMAKSLLDNKVVWVDEEDSRGRTALHYAVQQCNTESTSLLLGNGANVDAVDYTSTTPAHIACQEGMIDSVNLLLYYKADFLAIDKNGKTPFDLACEYGREKMVDRILDSGLPWRSLQKVNDSHRASALHLAARNGYVQICARLIQCGWDLNRVTSQGTCLHEAVAYGRINVVRFLLYIGVDPTLLNSSGQIAADVAKKYSSRNPISSKEIRRLLKEYNSFAFARAVQDFSGVSSEELTFSAGDEIWVIEREHSSSRWKGIIFGQKASSRSGYFAPSAVQLTDKPTKVIAMGSRVGSCGGSFSLQQPPRQMKKVSVPVVPDVSKMDAMISSQLHSITPSKFCTTSHSFRPFISSSNIGDERGVFTSSLRPHTMPAPSTSTNPSLYASCSPNAREPSTSTNGKTSACSMRPSTALTSNCMSAPGSSFPSTSHNQVRQLHAEHVALDLLSGGCHRNSTGSNSSQGSSSGFESMKSGSSRGGSSGGAASANSSSSSFLAASSNSSLQGSNTGALMRGDSPQSRVSVHSSSSGGSSSNAGSSIDVLDDSSCVHVYPSPSGEACSTDVADMVLKGVPEAEILAIWLDKLGHSEYLTLFLTQGYDLSTIARVTPEDLIALGITQPNHRKMLISEIRSWNITDSWPFNISSVREWLTLIGLPEYIDLFESQRYDSMSEIQKLTWEDFEDIGVKKLGHLKRLQLAAKKIKDHRLGCFSNTDGNSRAVPVTPHYVSNAQVKTTIATIHHHQAPPPPAPNSSFHSSLRSGNEHYATWTRYARPFHVPVENDIMVHKPTVQVYPHHRSPLPTDENEDFEAKTGIRPAAGFENDLDAKTVRLNLYSPARILSEESFAGAFPTGQARTHSNGILSVGDTTISSDSEDCPPPPAPLACEGSIRLLRSAFHGSPNPASSADSRFVNDGSSASSSEQIPFANDNCGTIRSREALQQTSSMSLSQPCTPRRSVHNVFIDDMDISKCYTLTGNENGDVLNDIGFMLQNLTDELDAMLLPSQRASTPATQIPISQKIGNADAS